MSANGLGVVLQDLQQRVAALEAQSTGGEELVPNYLTITPGGVVGANFTGVINALGLILPAALGGPPPSQSEIAWETPSGQIPITIAGISGGGGTQLIANAQAPSTTQQAESLLQIIPGSQTEAVLSVGQGGGQTSAMVEAILSGASQEPSVIATAEDLSLGRGNQVVTIIDQLGRSNFVQNGPNTLAGSTKTQYLQAGGVNLVGVPFGWQGPYTIPYPAPFPTNAIAVTYSLNPQGALSTIEASELQSLGSSSFAIDLNNDLAGQTIGVFFIAIGY